MNWEKKKEVVVPEAEYANGNWHMHWTNNNIFVCNYEILCGPCGLGKSEKEAFTQILAKIPEYRKTLDKIEAEVKVHLAELEEKEKNENKEEE